jgi:hypothetical protein
MESEIHWWDSTKISKSKTWPSDYLSDSVTTEPYLDAWNGKSEERFIILVQQGSDVSPLFFFLRCLHEIVYLWRKFLLLWRKLFLKLQ